ncbi:hypothetical protein DSO57_1006907 [Entomophthora muscae]|uniref:Uncharacterized protein n=1 Tax=Entomophthora muscae TaxID=34485 RepID=A0ACC2U612_9FUNG|nr:hypothetical protein DSO57_1006907 [Entomophthora muscae]
MKNTHTNCFSSEEQVRKEEDKVIRFSKALDDIAYQFNDGKTSPDSPILDPTASPSQVSLSLKPLGASSHKPPVPETASPSGDEGPLSPYSHLVNSQILEMQRQTFEDQDRNLDMLSQSLGRQREIGVIIGQELEHHVMLLDETSNAVDMTEARLNQAQSRLHRIDRKSKQCKLCGALVVLFIVLLVLLAIIRFFRL